VFKNGSRRREEADFAQKDFRLVTSAATALATVLELSVEHRFTHRPTTRSSFSADE
jgi:hypothetical protein